jgi:aminotransferase EvaB
MPVPFNDLKRRHEPLRAEILADVGALLDSGWLIGGKPVTDFEQAFAAWCGAAHAIGVANGTDALEFALRAAGVGAGDEVICVANAGGYATIACQTIGASPVYVDVDPATLQLDPSQIEAALSEASRAIIVTHLYGLMNDVAAIRAELARLGRSDIMIVEDCAQAHGAARGNSRAGSLGDIAAFSFYPTKNLGAIGDAGCVVCQDEALATAVSELRQYGWVGKYHVARPHGRNSRLDPIQALSLLRQLPLVDADNQRRRALCERYRQSLPAGWRLVGADDASFVGHLAVLIAPDEASRDAMRASLSQRGIGTDIHYPVLDCDQTGWQGFGRVVGELEASRSATRRILSLPCFPELSEAEQLEIIAALGHGGSAHDG